MPQTPQANSVNNCNRDFFISFELLHRFAKVVAGIGSVTMARATKQLAVQ
jgi:hypothetical protein